MAASPTHPGPLATEVVLLIEQARGGSREALGRLLETFRSLLLAVAETGQTFARLEDGSFVPSRHIAEHDRFAPDFVAVAEKFAGVPYLWAGKSRLGVDCSGLLQVAMHASGLDCPRDSDIQQAELGKDVAIRDDLDGLMRGDIVFWKGHLGIMIDGFLLLHANAHHMAVVAESLRTAVDRIARAGSAITAIRRLESKSA